MVYDSFCFVGNRSIPNGCCWRVDFNDVNMTIFYTYWQFKCIMMSPYQWFTDIDRLNV